MPSRCRHSWTSRPGTLKSKRNSPTPAIRGVPSSHGCRASQRSRGLGDDYRDAMDALTELADSARDAPDARASWARFANNLALLQVITGRREQAEADFREAKDVQEKLTVAAPSIAGHRWRFQDLHQPGRRHLDLSSRRGRGTRPRGPGAPENPRRPVPHRPRLRRGTGHHRMQPRLPPGGPCARRGEGTQLDALHRQIKLVERFGTCPGTGRSWRLPI